MRRRSLGLGRRAQAARDGDRVLQVHRGPVVRRHAPGDRLGGSDVAKIEIRGLSKSFQAKHSSLEVLRDLTLFAHDAEFVSIIGPSGCGKSTLFNIMAGLEPASGGDVFMDGQPVTGRKEFFAYMPQKDLLFPWRRIIDNTTLGLEVRAVPKKEARAQARPLFDTFGLAGFESAYPFELSGGMRQRAALLRTVVQGRSVILLDEPFGALDSLTRTEMQEWLEGVWERYRWTVFLITHDIREAVFLSDRVYVLTTRPATVKAVIEVPVPRPRALEVIGTPQFLAIEAALVRSLHEESAKARAQAPDRA